MSLVLTQADAMCLAAINAIKELNTKIETLEAKNKVVTSQVAELQKNNSNENPAVVKKATNETFNAKQIILKFLKIKPQSAARPLGFFITIFHKFFSQIFVTMNSIKILSILFLFPLLVAAQKNKEQNAIAYIEETVILKAAVGFEKNTREIDSLKQVYSKEIQDSQSQLNTKLETLLKPYNFSKEMSIEEAKAKLKETDKEKFELYVKENELLSKTGENYNMALKNKYDQKVQPILTKINTAIETYAKANGIKVVYTLEKISLALAYIDKGVNITEEIIKGIKAN